MCQKLNSLTKPTLEQLNIFIENTLKETSKTASLYKWVNIIIVVVGILILGAAV
jgi:hypothetical protein